MREYRYIWGSDVPHEVTRWPSSIEVLDEQLSAAGVTAAEKTKMTVQNAIDLFHIDGVAV